MRFLLLIALLSSNAFAEIRETKSMAEAVRAADKDTLLIFDIDNTLLEPVTQLGSDQWFYFLQRKYIEIDGLSESQIHDKSVVVWNKVQATVKVKAVEAATPKLVKDIQARKIKTMALTARSQEAAANTTRQLDSLGVSFKKGGISEKDLDFQSDKPAHFISGVVYVGEGNDKGKVLVKFLEELKLKPKKIVFIDDKIKNVKNVEAALETAKLPFLGFRYGATDEKVKAFNDDTADIRLFLGDLPK